MRPQRSTAWPKRRRKRPWTTFNLLFANQPEENSAGLTDDELAALAEQAGGGAAADCIADWHVHGLRRRQTQAHEIAGTPTIEVNGKRLDLQAGEITEMEKLIG